MAYEPDQQLTPSEKMAEIWDGDRVGPRWIVDRETMELFERQEDNSYRFAYRIVPAEIPATTDERVRMAYSAFIGGFTGFCPAPRWDEASPWIRDIVKIAYLQGKLDAKRD